MYVPKKKTLEILATFLAPLRICRSDSTPRILTLKKSLATDWWETFFIRCFFVGISFLSPCFMVSFVRVFYAIIILMVFHLFLLLLFSQIMGIKFTIEIMGICMVPPTFLF